MRTHAEQLDYIPKGRYLDNRYADFGNFENEHSEDMWNGVFFHNKINFPADVSSREAIESVTTNKSDGTVGTIEWNDFVILLESFLTGTISRDYIESHHTSSDETDKYIEDLFNSPRIDLGTVWRDDIFENAENSGFNDFFRTNVYSFKIIAAILQNQECVNECGEFVRNKFGNNSTSFPRDDWNLYEHKLFAFIKNFSDSFFKRFPIKKANSFEDDVDTEVSVMKGQYSYYL